MSVVKVEKIYETINDTKMGMFIKKTDKSAPVLLFLHGGPGMPEYFLDCKYESGLENEFTVVWWDQRGSGISYDKKLDKTTLTVEQSIEDIIGVTNFLKKRFSKEKIYLLAHSYGTYLGIQAVKRAPELFYAYLAVAQITYQRESERMAYEAMIEMYENKHDKRSLKKLKAHDYQSKEYGKQRDSLMHKAGIGTMHKMKSVAKDIFFESFRCKEYSLKEKINLWKGRVLLTSSEMEKTKLSKETDVRKLISSLEVPVYFFSGRYDYTVNYKMAEEYLRALQAPKKKFYLFKQSAHSPMFEEPEEFMKVMKEEVLKEKGREELLQHY